MSFQIRRTGELLRSGAEERVTDYYRRFDSVKDVYQEFLCNLIVSDFDYARAYATANEIFSSDTIRFAAVDGTEYARQLHELVIFFGGAYASLGTIRFNKSGKPTVEYSDRIIEYGKGISSCIPLHVSDIPDIDRSPALAKSHNDQAVFDNSKIADWIMAFSEFYIAYRMIIDEGVQLLLMDRTLSGEHSALLSDTAKLKWIEDNDGLLGLEVDGVRIDRYHLAFGRGRVVNPSLDLPPSRGDYLRHRLMYLLEKNGELSLKEICSKLHIDDPKRRNRVGRLLDSGASASVFRKTASGYTLDKKYRGTWDRLKKLVVSIGDRLFMSRGLEKTGNPMLLEKRDRRAWLTTVDLAFLTLFCLYMIIEESWKRRVLLIGLTKDTSARDFMRQVLTVCSINKVLDFDVGLDRVREAPSTDRMFLQSVSVFNHEVMKVPWALTEYDSAFKTIVPYLEKPVKPMFVSGATANRIVQMERLFLKSYIQLAQSSFDPKLRSNVLLIDRLVYPEYDLRADTRVQFRHEYGSTDEPVTILLFKRKEVDNLVQNLVLTVLESMCDPSIPEMFGHNKPLFIADNVAKWNFREFKRIVDATQDWILNSRDLRRFTFYMDTFRERRARYEYTRRATT